MSPLDEADMGAENASLFMKNMASAIMAATQKSEVVDLLMARVDALEAQLASGIPQPLSAAQTNAPAPAAVVATQPEMQHKQSDVDAAQAELVAAESSGNLAAVEKARAAVAAAGTIAAGTDAHSVQYCAQLQAELVAAESSGDLAAVEKAQAAVAAVEAKQRPQSTGPAVMQTLYALQVRIDREFESLHRDLDSVKDQTQPVQAAQAGEDVFEQMLTKTQENAFLTQRIVKMETRHHKSARHAASERATNAKRIRALEEIIQEMVQNKGKVTKSRKLGAAAAQEEMAAEEEAKSSQAPLVRKHSLVSDESLQLHMRDMKDLHSRTAAAVKIQRVYRRHLHARNWPEIDFRAWAPEDETDKDVIEIEVEEATMVTPDADQKTILRKLNTHTNSIVALQSHMNEFSRIMKRDREENRKLHDEMLDYIESSTTFADEMKEAHIKIARLMDGHATAQAEIILLQKDCQALRTSAQDHYDDTEIHRPAHGGGGNSNVSGPRIEMIESKLSSHQQLLDVLGSSVDGNSVADSVQLANKRHVEVSDKLTHIQKVMQQINDTAEDAQEKSKIVGRRIDDIKSKSTGNLESNITALGSRVSDLFSGHQTLSGSVQHLQRHVHTMLDRPKDNEEKDKLEAKISLMWRAKADRDEVDRAITRAVNTILKRIPEEEQQGGADGPLLATWSCLGCGKRHKEMGSAHKEMDEALAGGMPGSKTRAPGITFGKLRSAADSSANRVPPLALSSPTMPPNSKGIMPPIKSQTARDRRQMTATGGRGGPSGFNPKSAPSPKARKMAESFATTQPLPEREQESTGMRGSKKLSGSGGFQSAAIPEASPTVSSLHYD